MEAAPAPPAVPFPDGLPNSAKQVFDTLAVQGPLTHKDLVRATGMPGRTVRYAVGRLKEAGVLGSRCNLQDCRQCYFWVANECDGSIDNRRIPVKFAGIKAS